MNKEMMREFIQILHDAAMSDAKKYSDDEVVHNFYLGKAEAFRVVINEFDNAT